MQFTIYNEQELENILIALPALGERKEVYKKLAERLPDFKIISFDLPGHNGYMPKDFTIRNFTSNLHKQLKELDIKKAHFMGNSIGAWIIQHYYKMYPSDVISLWLLDGGHFFEEKLETEMIVLPVTERLEDITETVETLANELSDPTDASFFKNYFNRNFIFQDNLYKHHANENIVNALAKELDTNNYCSATYTIPTYLCISGDSLTDDNNKIFVTNFEEKHQLKAIVINKSTHLLPLTNSKEIAELIQEQMNVI